MSDSDCPETPRPASDPRQQTSFTLLERLRANEGDAWRIMVQLYTPLVHHWCVRGGVRGADAEDVVQEVLRAAAGHMDDFRRDRPGDSVRAWLRGITRNMILQHFRRGGRHRIRDRIHEPSGGLALRAGIEVFGYLRELALWQVA